MKTIRDSPEKASLSEVDIEVGMRGSYIKKSRKNEMTGLHYRRSAHDIGFAVTITDEIMALEPLGEKLRNL
jgi:hypothetical protein